MPINVTSYLENLRLSKRKSRKVSFQSSRKQIASNIHIKLKLLDLITVRIKSKKQSSISIPSSAMTFPSTRVDLERLFADTVLECRNQALITWKAVLIYLILRNSSRWNLNPRKSFYMPSTLWLCLVSDVCAKKMCHTGWQVRGSTSRALLKVFHTRTYMLERVWMRVSKNFTWQTLKIKMTLSLVSRQDSSKKFKGINSVLSIEVCTRETPAHTSPVLTSSYSWTSILKKLYSKPSRILYSLRPAVSVKQTIPPGSNVNAKYSYGLIAL